MDPATRTSVSGSSQVAITGALWIPTLRQAFPRYGGRRTQLLADLERLRRLRNPRNRNAHHEPIFARHVATDRELVLDIVGYLEPQARAWTTTHSRVTRVVTEGAAPVDGPRPTAF